MKKVVSIYSSFGKCDNETLRGRYVIEEDNRDTREDIIGEYGGDDVMGEKERFLNLEQNNYYISCDGGDWDEPTGFFFWVAEPEEVISEIQEKADEEIEALNLLLK